MTGDKQGKAPKGDWMPNRVIRVPDGIWNAAKAAADRRGESLAEAIRRFLDQYGKDQG